MRCFIIDQKDIQDIALTKSGMTNRSYLFSLQGERFLFRIPGEGTAQLINREQEAEVYQAIAGKGICDDLVFLDPENGYKISRFLEQARTCDPKDKQDVAACMRKLRGFHELDLKVGHSFDLYKQIDSYEKLFMEKTGGNSCYADYSATKERVFRIKALIDGSGKQACLTHVDAVCDNFLLCSNGQIQLMDWEYAGMQDPHLDVAMFAIYSGYHHQELDELISMYFDGSCDRETRVKIYCYAAAAGLLWSNWCEYKTSLGARFGMYAKRQYQYAKDFSDLVCKEY